MKKMFLSFITGTFIIITPLFADAPNPNPYSLNVFATQNIGTSGSNYGSDFEGMAGAGGNAYFSGFSLNATGTYSPSQPYSLFTGGNVFFGSGSVNNGGIEAGGNVNLSSITVNGPISAGGSLQGGNGTVNGNVSVGGANTSALTINGSIATGQAFSPTLNLTDVSNYFKSASSFWGGLAQTANWVNSFGQIQVSGLQSGRNIVNLNYSDLAGVYGAKLTGPSDAFVIFNINNVPSGGGNLQFLSLDLSGGITNSDILVNLAVANSLSINGGSFSVLAPNTDITYGSGALNGILVAQNLYGSGQVNKGTFDGFATDQGNFSTEVPEPSTYMLLGTMLLVGAVIQKRRSNAVLIK